MTPLIKKTLFRIRKIKRPLKSDEEKIRSIIAVRFRRGAVSAVLVLIIIGIIFSGRFPLKTTLHEGDIATEDIYAPFDFSYTAGIDEQKTKEKREAAQAAVLDIYSIDPNLLNKAKSEAEKFFDEFISIKTSGAEINDTEISKLKSKIDISISADDIKTLLNYPDIKVLYEKVIYVLGKVYSIPILSSEAKKSLLSSGKKEIQLYLKPQEQKEAEKTAEVNDLSDRAKIIEPLLQEAKIDDKKIKDILQKLIIEWTVPDLVYNAEATESEKTQAAAAISPIYNLVDRVKGEVIIRKGQKVGRDHIIQFDALGEKAGIKNIALQFPGVVIIVCLLAFLTFIYLKDFEPKLFSQDKILFLVGILFVFIALSARLIVSSPLSGYLIPVACVSMLLTLLVSGTVAVTAAIACAVIVAIIAGAKFSMFLLSIVGGMAAIYTTYRARHRNQIIKSGVYVGILNFITICAIGILSNFEVPIFLKEGLWGIANGLLSAAITMILLPVFESCFKLTTDIKLLELADLNHPLLKEMATKAQGTYHHSLLVGNLAEQGADATGANSLLARVGSYYHDIGKIEKSEYFAENTYQPSDMHEKLSPSMSSLIITNHVKDAVELAEKYKLGNAIKDIIEQHHGTCLVTYFYHQALETTQEGEPVSEEGFRYPGPKPHTKEAAIVMLADSVEAASRVLQNPTPQRLTELVRKIINNKIIDRQLDECELTLKDINGIASSFVKVLTGVYHSRIEYPSSLKTKYADIDNKRTKKNPS